MSWFKGKGLRFKITVFCSVLLITVQCLSFYIVNYSSLQYAEQQTKKSLSSANLVFQQLIDSDAAQLLNASTVLSADFGFRKAVATKDKGTILSVIQNHGTRIGADIAMVVSVSGNLLANSADTNLGEVPLPVKKLINEAKSDGQAYDYIVFQQQIFQATVVPVQAPDTIAWLVLGFVVDNKLANKLKKLTNLHTSFVELTEQGISLPISTLSAHDQASLLSNFRDKKDVDKALAKTILNSGEFIYHITSFAFAENSQYFKVIQHDNNDALYYLSQLRNLLIMLLFVSILISLIGIAVIANTVTKPLRMLANISDYIKDGDYSKAEQVVASGEIGKLAKNFSVMSDSITSLIKLAYKDQLTDLPNRAMFTDVMNQAIEKADKFNQEFTLLFLDLNKFKAINDTYGHEAGDKVLQSVSLALKNSIRKIDTVARLGGDEFAIIVLSENVQVIQRIIDTIYAEIEGNSIDIDNTSVFVGCSIGSATYLKHANNSKELMHYADQSMYAIKESRAQKRN